MESEINKKCAYCGIIRPISEMHRGKITAIQNRRVVEIENWYCNGKPCHGNDQMAHEG